MSDAYKLKLHLAQRRADQWNVMADDEGEYVRYHPVIDESEYRLTRTTSKAWVLDSGDILVNIRGLSGGVSLDALSPASGEEIYRMMIEEGEDP